MTTTAHDSDVGLTRDDWRLLLDKDETTTPIPGRNLSRMLVRNVRLSWRIAIKELDRATVAFIAGLFRVFTLQPLMVFLLSITIAASSVSFLPICFLWPDLLLFIVAFLLVLIDILKGVLLAFNLFLHGLGSLFGVICGVDIHFDINLFLTSIKVNERPFQFACPWDADLKKITVPFPSSIESFERAVAKSHCSEWQSIWYAFPKLVRRFTSDIAQSIADATFLQTLFASVVVAGVVFVAYQHLRKQRGHFTTAGVVMVDRALMTLLSAGRRSPGKASHACLPWFEKKVHTDRKHGPRWRRVLRCGRRLPRKEKVRVPLVTLLHSPPLRSAVRLKARAEMRKLPVMQWLVPAALLGGGILFILHGVHPAVHALVGWLIDPSSLDVFDQLW